MKRYLWKDGRLTWPLVLLIALATAFLLWFDWYWRTHDTSFARFF